MAIFSCSAILIGALSLTFVYPTGAQIIEIREYHGHRIDCVQSGLHGWSSSCGTDRGYEEIFAGSILTAVPVSERETELTLKPEEVFFGVPESIVKVRTGQGDCLPEFRAGDRWLFYLQKDTKTNDLILWYGSPSGLLDDAKEQIELLRRLAKQNDSGVVRGYVNREQVDEDKSVTYLPVTEQQIIATAKSGKGHFVAVTNEEGKYEFPQLPLGTYVLTANTQKGLWAEEGTLDVTPHSCSAVGFDLQPDGVIAGHLRTAMGQPGAGRWAILLPSDPQDTTSQSAYSDAQGYFQFHAVKPGRYVVGVTAPGISDDTPIAYFPGVPSRVSAVTITLGLAEHQTHVDFELPRQPK